MQKSCPRLLYQRTEIVTVASVQLAKVQSRHIELHLRILERAIENIQGPMLELCVETVACSLLLNAAVNGKLELTLLKGRQRFDTVSTSNLKV